MGLYFTVFALLFLYVMQIQSVKQRVMLNVGQIRICFDRFIYAVFICVLLYVAVFAADRSGDYFVYKDIFEAAPLKFDFSSDYIKYYHTEIGWKLCCIIFRKAGLSYEVFFGAVSAVSLLFLARFMNRFCQERRTFALLWLYVSFYLVYFYI